MNTTELSNRAYNALYFITQNYLSNKLNIRVEEVTEKQVKEIFSLEFIANNFTITELSEHRFVGKKVLKEFVVICNKLDIPLIVGDNPSIITTEIPNKLKDIG